MDPHHPLVASLPDPFQVASWPNAQATSRWEAALLADTEIVAQSTDGLQVVLAHESGWRGAWVSGYSCSLRKSDLGWLLRRRRLRSDFLRSRSA